MLANLAGIKQVQSGRARIRNAFTPLIWFTAATGGVLLGMPVSGAPVWATALAATLWAICVVSGLFAYFWFLVKDPNRLQSEDYQIQRDMLHYIQGRGQPPIVDQTPLVANTAVLSEGEQ